MDFPLIKSVWFEKSFQDLNLWPDVWDWTDLITNVFNSENHDIGAAAACVFMNLLQIKIHL